jgi:hypothetical protein
VESARNIADAAKYAADALRDGGFQVSEEPFVKMVRRPYNRSLAAAVWFAGSVGIAIATLLLASGKYAHLILEPGGAIAIAVTGWTVLLDRWYARKSREVPSANIKAIRGEPRIWLVGTLAMEEEPTEARLRPFLEITVAAVAASFVLRMPGLEKIAWLLPLSVAYGAMHWFLRRRFSARTSLALAPATGVAAILGACEQLAGDQDLGIVLRRDTDPEGRAMRWALAGRQDATTIVVGHVGGPEELQLGYAKSAREIVTRMRSVAEAEQLQLDVVKQRLRISWFLAGLNESAVASATLFRPERPVVSRHVLGGILSRVDHRASFDPVEQIAKASRLLVRTIEQEREESK